MEDAPDSDPTAITIVEVPPEAPAPPSAAPPQTNVSVFDFLVNEETPNASKISLIPGTDKPQTYVPSALDPDIATKRDIITTTDPHYDTHGFSYGTSPLPSPPRHKKEKKDEPKFEFITPGTRDLRHQLEQSYAQQASQPSTEKKRKRHQPDDLDLTALHDSDAMMEDAAAAPPAPPLHSGLTGGLTRLLSHDRDSYSPSPDLDPQRGAKSSQSLAVVKSRDKHDGRERSRLKSTSSRRRRTSDESRPRKKKHRTHSEARTEDSVGSTSRHRRKHRSRRAIEYPTTIDEEAGEQVREGAREGGQGGQLIKYATRAEFFMSLVTKGEDSARGMSVHKVLKRYHRERAQEREEEEKELFKGLRIRRNERGEVVVFF